MFDVIANYRDIMMNYYHREVGFYARVLRITREISLAKFAREKQFVPS